MSWLGRLKRLFVSLCGHCGGPTVIESEQLIATVPAVFDVVAWCPRCGEVVSRREVVDCLP